MLPSALETQLQESTDIFEGRVTSQESFMGDDGNIYTANQFEVYRVLKGNVGFNYTIVTEGGIYGDLMQVVTPSVGLWVGDYGLVVSKTDMFRSSMNVAQTFYPINETNGEVFRLKGIDQREQLYELVSRATGTNIIELRRISLELESAENRAAPQIASISPVQVTAGTQTVITITGQNFGQEQGNGYVAFRNADNGGQSFVSLAQGPHYLSWSDTEIQLYVPSATLYNQAVAGTGTIRVVTGSGNSIESVQNLSVRYAKSEVIYSSQLSSTLLVGNQSGGYVFTPNANLVTTSGGTELAHDVLEKWACNTGVNFRLADEVVNSSEYAYDDVNLLGLSAPGQLPGYMLGRTVTTFSGCGGSNGLQWNLVEIDILLNSDIAWWTGEDHPMPGTFDMETALLHEVGHAHLLQHNNNQASPMYFQLTDGDMRRDFHPVSDVEGGDYIATISSNAESVCGEDNHQVYDFSSCNLSVINTVEEMDESNVSMAYPNPFEDVLNLTAKSGNTGYQLFDALGRKMLSGTLTIGFNEITSARLPSGVYFLEILSESEREVLRLVKN